MDEKAHHDGDGLSWKHAFKDLQSALEFAAITDGPNEIWVAKGTYTPTALNISAWDAGYPPFSLAGTKPTFTIPHNTYLYGGFKGDECERYERNPEKHVTILSGDIDQNDKALSTRGGPGFPLKQNYLDSKLDNARHVVTIVNADVTLDGFTIAKGFAGDLPNLVTDQTSNFLFRETMRGGGVLAKDSSLVLENIIFDDCEAYDSQDLFGGIGGALFTLRTHLVMDKVKMTNGYAPYFGPAFVVVEGECSARHLKIENNEGRGCTSSLQDVRFDVTKSTFKNNVAEDFCGALQVLQVNQEPTGHSSITKCTFEDNTGGVCASLDLINQSGLVMPEILVKNCKFARNKALKLFEGNVSCGAICDYSYNALIVENLFENNSGLTCGAICATQNDFSSPIETNVIIKDSIFNANHQVGMDSLGGGAIHFLTGVTGDILQSSFHKNISDTNGGAIALENARAFLKCNSFDSNSAALQGAAIYSHCSVHNEISECNSFKSPSHDATVCECAPLQPASTLKQAVAKRNNALITP